MGDHSRVNCGSCRYTNCSLPGAEKRPPQKNIKKISSQQTTRKTTLTEAETTILKIINDDCILFRYTFHWRSVRAVVFLVSSLVILVVLVTSIAGYMQLTLHHNRHPHPHTHTTTMIVQHETKSKISLKKRLRLILFLRWVKKRAQINLISEMGQEKGSD